MGTFVIIPENTYLFHGTRSGDPSILDPSNIHPHSFFSLCEWHAVKYTSSNTGFGIYKTKKQLRLIDCRHENKMCAKTGMTYKDTEDYIWKNVQENNTHGFFRVMHKDKFSSLRSAFPLGEESLRQFHKLNDNLCPEVALVDPGSCLESALDPNVLANIMTEKKWHSIIRHLSSSNIFEEHLKKFLLKRYHVDVKEEVVQNDSFVHRSDLIRLPAFDEEGSDTEIWRAETFISKLKLR